MTGLIIRNLEDHFGSLQRGVVLHRLHTLDLTTWPDNRQELASYGEESLIKLYEHFQPLLADNITAAHMKANFIDYKVFAHHRERYSMRDPLCLILRKHI